MLGPILRSIGQSLIIIALCLGAVFVVVPSYHPDQLTTTSLIEIFVPYMRPILSLAVSFCSYRVFEIPTMSQRLYRHGHFISGMILALSCARLFQRFAFPADGRLVRRGGRGITIILSIGRGTRIAVATRMLTAVVYSILLLAFASIPTRDTPHPDTILLTTRPLAVLSTAGQNISLTSDQRNDTITTSERPLHPGYGDTLHATSNHTGAIIWRDGSIILIPAGQTTTWTTQSSRTSSRIEIERQTDKLQRRERTSPFASEVTLISPDPNASTTRSTPSIINTANDIWIQTIMDTTSEQGEQLNNRGLASLISIKTWIMQALSPWSHTDHWMSWTARQDIHDQRDKTQGLRRQSLSTTLSDSRSSLSETDQHTRQNINDRVRREQTRFIQRVSPEQVIGSDSEGKTDE